MASLALSLLRNELSVHGLGLGHVEREKSWRRGARTAVEVLGPNPTIREPLPFALQLRLAPLEVSLRLLSQLIRQLPLLLLSCAASHEVLLIVLLEECGSLQSGSFPAQRRLIISDFLPVLPLGLLPVESGRLKLLSFCSQFGFFRFFLFKLVRTQ